MNRFFVCVPLLAICSTIGRADDAKPQPENAAIEKVVADSLKAAGKQDWQKYADLFHADSLDDYRKMWQPALTAAAKNDQTDLLTFFDKAADVKSILDLKPKEFFASSMKGITSQFQQGIPNPLTADTQIIGTVREGKDRAYVVVRTQNKLGDPEMTKVEVVELKRSGTEWKMELPDVVRLMAKTFSLSAPGVQKAGPVIDRVEPDKQP